MIFGSVFVLIKDHIRLSYIQILISPWAVCFCKYAMIAHLMLFLGLISRGRFRSLSHWSCPKMPGTYSTAKGSNCQSKFWIHFITSLTSQENFYFGHNYKTNKLVLLVQYIDRYGFFFLYSQHSSLRPRRAPMLDYDSDEDSELPPFFVSIFIRFNWYKY